MTKEDIILQEIKYVRCKVDDLGSDVAVLKSKHDTGNLSEKIAAGVAIIALIVSLWAVVSSCRNTENESNLRRSTTVGLESPWKRSKTDKSK